MSQLQVIHLVYSQIFLPVALVDCQKGVDYSFCINWNSKS